MAVCALYICISVGLSALLVSIDRAMRRPRYVKQATAGSTFFMFMEMPFLRICWLWSSLAKGTSVTMDLIQNNPYRLLGVFANAPTKERVASQTKLKAFLKVGKSVNYPLDLPKLLAPIERTAESVATAEAQIALPAEQMAFAQFWFVKSSALDDIAFNHLFT